MKRKVVVNLIETNNLNNARLVEYFTNKIKERGLNYDIKRI
jgi:hypothetical protein